jgi:hypothetical protein
VGQELLGSHHAAAGAGQERDRATTPRDLGRQRGLAQSGVADDLEVARRVLGGEGVELCEDGVAADEAAGGGVQVEVEDGLGDGPGDRLERLVRLMDATVDVPARNRGVARGERVDERRGGHGALLTVGRARWMTAGRRPRSVGRRPR